MDSKGDFQGRRQVPTARQAVLQHWQLRKAGLRVTRESKGPLGAGSKSLLAGAQNSNRGTLTCGGGARGGQGFAWWCH